VTFICKCGNDAFNISVKAKGGHEYITAMCTRCDQVFAFSITYYISVEAM